MTSPTASSAAAPGGTPRSPGISTRTHRGGIESAGPGFAAGPGSAPNDRGEGGSEAPCVPGTPSDAEAATTAPPSPLHHVLVVLDAGEPYTGPLDSHDWADWEIEHPDDCPTEQIDLGDGEIATEYRCAVGYQVDAIGARWSLRYSGCPVDAPGRYPITTWHEVLRGFDYTEHDGGLCLVDGDPS